MSPLISRLLLAVCLVSCVVFSVSSTAEAKSRKGRSVSSHSRTKIVRAAHGARVGRGRHHIATERDQEDFQSSQFARATHPIVPDRVEVVEYGSANPSDINRLANSPAPQSSINASFGASNFTEPARRKNVNIESSRVMQIQQALANRGFYQGEITGGYDDPTINAMQRFQASQRVPATGYPTAHALKRLGLASW